MNKVENAIDSIIKVVMGISALVLSVVTLLQVITRTLLKNPLPWGQDVIRLSFIYLVFWGGAYCVKMKEHLNIDILLTSLPTKGKRILEILINLVCLVFFVFLLYYGYQFMLTGQTQKAPYLKMSMIWFYASLPSAAVFMIFYQLKELITQFKDFNKEEKVEEELK